MSLYYLHLVDRYCILVKLTPTMLVSNLRTWYSNTDALNECVSFKYMTSQSTRGVLCASQISYTRVALRSDIILI